MTNPGTVYVLMISCIFWKYLEVLGGKTETTVKEVKNCLVAAEVKERKRWDLRLHKNMFDCRDDWEKLLALRIQEPRTYTYKSDNDDINN